MQSEVFILKRSEPWITPSDVIAYTTNELVFARSQIKLKVDILRAQEYVISLTNNTFSDEEYPTLPENVRVALILLAELYAKQAENKANPKFSSETYSDDYSYTLADTSDADELAALNLSTLLSDYINPVSSGKISMDIFKL